MRSHSSNGFSLVETIVGIVVFAIASIGLLKLITFTQYQAVATLNQHAATNVATGILEFLVNSDNAEVISNNIPITLHDGTELMLRKNQWVSMKFDLKGTPDNPEDDLPIDLLLTTDNQLNSPSPHIRIILAYRWPKNLVGQAHLAQGRSDWIQSEIMIVRSNVRSFSE